MTFFYYYSIEIRMGLNSNQMEDQIGAVLHWSHQKEPKQAKRKDEVISRNLDRIRISAATPLPSNTSKRSQVSLIQKKKKKIKKNPDQKKLILPARPCVRSS